MSMSFFSRLREDRGVALPVSLAILVAVAGLATVAARSGIVYAPYSTIRIHNNGTLSGAIASKAIDIQNSAHIVYHERIADITTGSPLLLFKPERFLECTAVPPDAAPESGC